MEMDQSKLIEGLSSIEIDALINLYYNQEGKNQGISISDLSEEALTSLVDKNLISTKLGEDESLISLTESGLNLCGTVMQYQIESKEELFKEKIQSIPERTVATLVNRVMWKEEAQKESGMIDPITKPYALDETLWYERVLLKDNRIQGALEDFYTILEDINLVKNIEGQRWCSPEVEVYLKNEYKDMMDLTWQEEDSLKYYYFFYVYAQDQRNLINFTEEGQEFKSMFYGDSENPPDYWFSSNRADPRSLLTSLGIGEPRIIEFLEEMNRTGVVNERYYPLSALSFFEDEDRLFIIRDIKKYMDFIANNFLIPVVSALLS
jgi:hypothetical protein